MEFNPWQFSGTGNIATAFFTELGIALDTASAGIAGRVERAERLSRYAKRLTLCGSAVEAVGTALTVLGMPGGEITKSAGKKIKQAGTVTQEGSTALQSEADQRSMSALKAELADSLAALKKPLLVVIDDIDRLTTEEIREVLQLIKANADFPNVIYLLLCERSIVSAALDAISGDRGSEFLEKIVQVGYNVPHVTSEAIQKVLFQGLNECLSFPGVAARWDKNRWYELYSGSLASYFKNLRHVYRFLASFAFHVQQFQRGEGFEVNPIDLIALETLRVFETAVYEQLPGAKQLLTEDDRKHVLDGIERNDIESAITQILKPLPENRRKMVQGVLQLLFPLIATRHEGYSDTSRQSLLRGARVCHPDLFDKYFTLVIAEDDLSQTELDRLVGLAKNRQQFVGECQRLVRRGLLKIAFERLDAFKDEIPLDAMPSLICALCDICDTIEQQEGFSLSNPFDPTAIAWRLVYFGLRREQDRARRVEVLRTAFKESSGIFLPADIVRSADRTDSEGDMTESFLNEADIPALKELVLEKIRGAIRSGTFRKHLHAHTLLWLWQRWTPDEVRAWITDKCTTPEKAAWVISLLMSHASSNGVVKYYIRLSDVANYGDVSKFEGMMACVDEEKFPEKQKIAVKEFRRALQRRKEGKPEMDGYLRLDLND